MFKPKFTRSFWFVCACLCSLLLNCSTFNFDKAQNGQIRRHCVVKCFHSGVETFGRALIDEKMSTRQSCFQDCMRKFGNQSSFGNHHTKHLFTRLKRESEKKKENTAAWQSTQECDKTATTWKLMAINSTYIDVNFSNNSESISADISWSRAPESANVTSYKLVFAYINRSRGQTDYLCQDLNKTKTSAKVDLSSFLLKEQDNFYIKVITLPPMKRDVVVQYISYRILIVPQDQSTVPVSQKTTSSAAVPVSQKTTSPTAIPVSQKTTSPTAIPVSQKTTSPTAKSQKTTSPRAMIIAVCVALISAIALALLCLYRRYIRLSRSRDQDVGFEFDAFIIYNSGDEEWVNKTLRRTLEDKYGLRCCLHYRDFIPGKPFRENMADSVYKSKKTIAVVSHNFFRSKYCSHEMDMALGCSLQRGDNSVIVIKLDDVDKNKLPKALKDRSFIDYGKLIERESWEKKLIDSMRPPSKQKTEACFV